jgi:hypothetical protein
MAPMIPPMGMVPVPAPAFSNMQGMPPRPGMYVSRSARVCCAVDGSAPFVGHFSPIRVVAAQLPSQCCRRRVRPDSSPLCLSIHPSFHLTRPNHSLSVCVMQARVRHATVRHASVRDATSTRHDDARHDDAWDDDARNDARYDVLRTNRRRCNLRRWRSFFPASPSVCLSPPSVLAPVSLVPPLRVLHRVPAGLCASGARPGMMNPGMMPVPSGLPPGQSARRLPCWRLCLPSKCLPLTRAIPYL